MVLQNMRGFISFHLSIVVLFRIFLFHDVLSLMMYPFLDLAVFQARPSL